MKDRSYSQRLKLLVIIYNMYSTQYTVKELNVLFFVFILIVSSLFLPPDAFKKEVYAQSSPPVTNTTAISDDNSMSGLQSKSVNYYGNSSGYLVYYTSAMSTTTIQEQKLPAVVMIHEWWGLNDNIKDMANMLAKEGYVVLAVDLFGEVATDPDRAMQLSSSVRNNPEEAIANMQAAVNYLGSLENVNSSRIASLGWCFGGGQSLQLALNSEEKPLAATVIYYGNLVTDEQALSTIKWPILGIFGDQDQSISVDTVDQFKGALDIVGITNEIYIYPGVGHAFANPSGDNYAPEETSDAWQKTLSFLDRYV
jgi:carboxymethylenebutenolidase